VTGARWQTLGGLAVDEKGRVLDAEGRTIPGLYAAGGAAAGLGGEGSGAASRLTLARDMRSRLDRRTTYARSKIAARRPRFPRRVPHASARGAVHRLTSAKKSSSIEE